MSQFSPYRSTILGRINHLQIVDDTDLGLFLQYEDNDDSDDEILLPKRDIPRGLSTKIGDFLDLFVYLDNKNRMVATTQTPRAQVGKFAVLSVIEINDVGIFLDWGLPKDLLLPFSEEVETLYVDDKCLVYVYLDERSNRITATTKIEQHLDQTPAPYQNGDLVDLVVAEQTDMGFKVIINHAHWGLVHKNELFKPLEFGMLERGFIKNIRPDGKIDVSLQPTQVDARDTLEDLIMKRLSEHGNILPLSDKSNPADIHKMFGVSKGNFKRALGGLYKEGKIIIEPKRILRKL